MNILPLVALLTSLLTPPAAALMPLPGPIPDAETPRRETLALFDQLDKKYAASNDANGKHLREFAMQIRAQAWRGQAKDRADTDRAIRLARSRTWKKASTEELVARLEYMHAAHMRTLWGYTFPVTFNLALRGCPEAAGYPAAVPVTAIEYCRRYQPMGTEVLLILSEADSRYRPDGPGYCGPVFRSGADSGYGPGDCGPVFRKGI